MNSSDQALPLITAAVACYNQAQFVVEALDSVKVQDYPNLQLIVVDDCSTDNSVDVIRQWLNANYPKAVLIAHTTNVGICRTANEVLANAKGKYFRALAADDRWIPNTLKRQVEVMERSPGDVCALYSDAMLLDEFGKQLPGGFIELHRQFAREPEGEIFDVLLEGNFIPAMTALIRLQCIQDVGGIDENLITEDWDLWLRLSRQFKFIYYPEPTAYYRIVPSSMVRTLSEKIIDSERRMFVKYLRRGWLKGKKKRQAIDAEFVEACRAYSQQRQDRVQQAVWSFRHRICAKHALLLLFVAGRIPYRQFERAVRLLGKMKNVAIRILNRDAHQEPQ